MNKSICVYSKDGQAICIISLPAEVCEKFLARHQIMLLVKKPHDNAYWYALLTAIKIGCGPYEVVAIFTTADAGESDGGKPIIGERGNREHEIRRLEAEIIAAVDHP